MAFMRIQLLRRVITLGIVILLFGRSRSLARELRICHDRFPGVLDTDLVGINSTRQIVGEARNDTSSQSSFKRDSRGALGPAFEYPEAFYTHPFGIDNAGDVIGSYVISSPQVLWARRFLPRRWWYVH
jgi:hypothetical protein